MLYTVSPHLPYVLSSYIHDNSKSNKNRCILQPRERHQQVRLAVVCLIHSHRNASFLVTAKNANDHSCWMLDSVAPPTPGGGGSAPSGVTWNPPSL